MPWDVKWFLYAEERSITGDERAALLAHAKAEEGRPWQEARYVLAVLGGSGLVAGGSTQVPDDLAHPDWGLLLSAITALRGIVPGARLKIEDSQGLIAWNEATAQYGTTGWTRAPAPPAAPPPEPEEALDAPIRALLEQLCAGGPDRYALVRSIPEQHDATRVARLGMALLPKLPKDDYPSCQRSDVASVVREALGRCPEIEGLAGDIRALFSARPDTDLPRHVASALSPVADRPLLVSLCTAVLSTDDSPPEVLTAVCELFTSVRAAADEIVPVLVARARRDRQLLGREIPWRERLLCALEMTRRPAALPTLLLDGAVDPKVLWRAISGAARCDGPRALPFLERAIGARDLLPGNVVGGIGDIQAPGAIPLLVRFLDHGDPSVRAAAADYLLGRRRLREVAAAWRGLDAVSHRRDDYKRERALQAFGIEGKPAAVDWDKLVRDRGEEPLPLAPPPTPLEALTDPDVNVRSTGRSTIEEGAAPGHLLAIALCVQMEGAVRQLGAPRTYPSFWRWSDLLTALGLKGTSDEETAIFVCKGAERLPPQELTPALRAILDGGLAEAASRCAAGLKEFFLLDEERAALDAEEAIVAARAGAPQQAQERVEAEDLFLGPHPEAEGPVLDPLSAEVPLYPEPFEHLPASCEEGGVVEIQAGQAIFTMKEGPVLPNVSFRGILRSRVRWLRLDAVEVYLRDASGAPLHVLLESVEQHLRPAGRVGMGGYPAGPKVPEARTACVYAVVRQPFQVLASRGELPPLSMDRVGRCDLAEVSSSPLLRTRTTVYAKRDGSFLGLEVVSEIGLAQPSRTVAHCEIALALRGARGQVLASRLVKRTLPADGSPIFVWELPGLDGEGLRAAKWLDIAVRGAITQRHKLCEFVLPGGALASAP